MHYVSKGFGFRGDAVIYSSVHSEVNLIITHIIKPGERSLGLVIYGESNMLSKIQEVVDRPVIEIKVTERERLLCSVMLHGLIMIAFVAMTSTLLRFTPGITGCTVGAVVGMVYGAGKELIK